MVKACEATSLDKALPMEISNPRIAAMWSVVKCLRSHLAHGVRTVAAESLGPHTDELQKVELVATLLLLRNALFFFSAARENRQQPRRRCFALALACAYADNAQSICSHGACKAEAQTKHGKTQGLRLSQRSTIRNSILRKRVVHAEEHPVSMIPGLAGLDENEEEEDDS